jgi:hypothetical protein
LGLALALGGSAGAAGLGDFVGTYSLQQGDPSCDAHLTIAQTAPNSLSLRASNMPEQVQLGTQSSDQDRYWWVKASLSGNTLSEKDEWGEHCLAAPVSVRSCMYWGIFDRRWQLAGGTLSFSETDTASGDQPVQVSCTYQRSP